MSESKLFAVAGIVTDEKGRTKVRYCNDLVGRIKLFTKNTANKRVEFIELPSPMTKLDAIKFLVTNDKFQSGEDQAVLSDALSSYEPKPKREPKAKVVKVTKAKPAKTAKKPVPTLDSIKSRAKKATVTVADVLAATTEVKE